jgi:hypothetical protein
MLYHENEKEPQATKAKKTKENCSLDELAAIAVAITGSRK